MKRHPALHDLARDHHAALVYAQRIRKAQECGEPSPEQAAAEFLKLWDEELVRHFREEEEVLLPILGRHRPPCEVPEVRRMLDDHAWFRDAVPRLQEALDEDGEWRELLFAIGRRLTEHARLEDRRLFVYLEETLTEPELEEVGRRSRAFRG